MSKKVTSIKKNWKGLFSYSCELEKLFVHAYTKEQAKVMFFHRLAKKHDVSYGAVAGMFDGSKSNYQITIETEYREDDG
uniref:Uncharacterized protein n=1 Tax=viral metagenome TaxID=1070528 RepID=A0A6M3J724_9ZZZZ